MASSIDPAQPTNSDKSNPADNIRKNFAAAKSEIETLQTSVTDLKAGKGITLPTADPHVAGRLWSDTGTVKVSAG